MTASGAAPGPVPQAFREATHEGHRTLMTNTLAPHHDAALLDNPVWHALNGPHASFAIGNDLVRRYPEDVAPFVAVRTWEDPGVWDALIDLVGRDAIIGLSGFDGDLPDGWDVVGRGAGVQLVQTDALRPRPDEEAIVLGADDVPE